MNTFDKQTTMKKIGISILVLSVIAQIIAETGGEKNWAYLVVNVFLLIAVLLLNNKRGLQLLSVSLAMLISMTVSLITESKMNVLEIMVAAIALILAVKNLITDETKTKLVTIKPTFGEAVTELAVAIAVLGMIGTTYMGEAVGHNFIKLMWVLETVLIGLAVCTKRIEGSIIIVLYGTSLCVYNLMIGGQINMSAIGFYIGLILLGLISAKEIVDEVKESGGKSHE